MQCTEEKGIFINKLTHKEGALLEKDKWHFALEMSAVNLTSRHCQVLDTQQEVHHQLGTFNKNYLPFMSSFWYNKPVQKSVIDIIEK